MLPPLQIRWHRIMGIYCVIAIGCLIAGVSSPAPVHDILLMIGVFLVAGFIPLIMLIYFVRGIRGTR